MPFIVQMNKWNVLAHSLDYQISRALFLVAEIKFLFCFAYRNLQFLLTLLLVNVCTEKHIGLYAHIYVNFLEGEVVFSTCLHIPMVRVQILSGIYATCSLTPIKFTSNSLETLLTSFFLNKKAYSWKQCICIMVKNYLLLT